MADLLSNIGGAAGGIIGGIGSLFGGEAAAAADQAEAQGFETAAQFAQENEVFTGESGALQELAAARQVQHVQGTQVATAAANGLRLSGSSLSLVRDTAQQGALSLGTISLQTSINATNFAAQAAADQAQAQAAKAAASAAETGGIFGFLGGAAKAIPLIGGLF